MLVQANVLTDSMVFLREELEVPAGTSIQVVETRYELRGSTLRLSDGYYRIFLSSEYPETDQLRTLCHEFIHIFQYIYKNLADEELKDWPKYSERWWEQEAIAKTPELFEKLCGFLLSKLGV